MGRYLQKRVSTTHLEIHALAMLYQRVDISTAMDMRCALCILWVYRRAHFMVEIACFFLYICDDLPRQESQ